MEVADEAGDLAEAVEDGVVVVAEGVEDVTGGLDEAGAVAGLLVAALDFFFLGGVEVGGFDFVDLVAEEVDFLLVGALGVAEVVELVDEFSPNAEVVAIGFVFFFGEGVGVEHVELALLDEEGLVIVGAVEIDQILAEGLEDVEGGGGAVDELFIGAAVADDAADDELVVLAGVEAGFLEDVVDLGWFDEIEDGFDGAGVLAGADEAAVCALAEDEL